MKNVRQRFLLAAAITFLFFLGLTQGRISQTAQEPQQTQQKQKPGEEIDPDDVIRINTTMINSPVLIIGRNGKFVPNLKREDFLVYENGVQQEIAHFSTVERPFTVAILIDTSRSTSVNLPDVLDAAASFVDSMRPNDRALVITFSGQVRVLAEPTTDHEALKRAIQSCRLSGSSRVYDAISFALREHLDRTAGRTALILFSDGVDNDSAQATYETTLQLIANTQTLIFPIQFSTYEFAERGVKAKRSAPEGSGFSRKDYLRADSYLHQVAALSGTGIYPAQDISDLNKAVARISDELHNEYSIGYYPVTPIQPGEERKIEVQTRLPQLVVKTRVSYSLNPSGNTTRLSSTVDPTSSVKPSEGSIPLPRNEALPKQNPDARWVCKSPEIPTHLVVVKEGFVSHCPKNTRANDTTNAWLVREPGQAETMCKGFMVWGGRELAGAPIPTGYVVTSETISPLCAKSSDSKKAANAWIINQPSTTTTACKGFTIPRGYVTVTEKFVPGCPSKAVKNAWTIRPK